MTAPLFATHVPNEDQGNHSPEHAAVDLFSVLRWADAQLTGKAFVSQDKSCPYVGTLAGSRFGAMKRT